MVSHVGKITVNLPPVVWLGKDARFPQEGDYTLGCVLDPALEDSCYQTGSQHDFT
jgi:hypothetical protein